MQIDIDKFVEILANLFRERQEIAMVIDGVKTVVGYTQPKTIIFNSDTVNVKKFQATP